MPLPKTATIAARATEVYCEVWSVILQRLCKMPPMRSSDLNDLSQLLPYLRQLLTCCACAGLLDKAMISLSCGHCYCYECQFREPLLKIHCRQCRERTGLVTERQLRLVVNCYKSMCHILGEELRKDPYAFSKHDDHHMSVNGEADDGDLKMSVTIPARLAAQVRGARDGGGGVESVNGRTVPPVANGVSADDPIAEIIREVEKGTKVSRAIFVIKPPSKYMNLRAAAQTPRRDSGMGNSISTGSASRKASSPLKDDSKEHTPELQVKTEEDLGMEINGEVKQVNVEGNNLNMDSEKQKQSRSKKRPCRKASQAEKRRKKIGTKSDGLAVGSLLEDSDSATPTDVDYKPKVTTKIPLSALKLNSRQRQLSARKRKKALSVLSKSKPELSRERKSTSRTSNVKTDSVPENNKGPSPSEVIEGQDLLTEVEVKDLDISVDSLDKKYVSVSEDKVTLLPHEQLSYKLSQATKDGQPSSNSSPLVSRDHWKSLTRQRTLSPFCSRIVVKRLGEDIAQNMLQMINAAKIKRKMRQKAKLAATMGGDKSHLPATPSPHVSRQRPRVNRSQRHSVPTPTVPVPNIVETDMLIPEHVILSADGKDTLSDADINWTEFSNFFESNEDGSIAELAKLDCYNHPSPSEQQPQEKLQEQLEQLKQPTQHELTKQQTGQKQHKEQHKEQPKQQQVGQKQHREQQQPLPPLPLPPMLPQLPCARDLDPLFREFDPPRMMHPPPHSHQHHHHHPHHHHQHHHPRHCLPPPPPHRPHPSMGRPTRLPHPHSRPLPPPPPHHHHHQIMPFSPMMNPPDLPPPPDYFPPPMTPRGMRPDMSGFSSPMTPNRANFPPEPRMDGMFHQGSPSQPHPRSATSGNFPFPSSRGSFSPVRGSFQPRPTPPTTPVMLQQPQKKKKKSAADDPLSGMVQKMKMKSPSTTPKANLAAPQTPTKKRRSPGYSEAGWRCRCGTNKIMFPDKVCAKGKCPCYAKGTACKNCLCRFCHNPFGAREPTKSVMPTSAALTPTAETSPDKTLEVVTAGSNAEVKTEASDVKADFPEVRMEVFNLQADISEVKTDTTDVQENLNPQ